MNRLLLSILNAIGQFFWPRNHITIKPGKVVVIIGRPGSGKSTLLRWLLKDCNSVVVYDSKFDPNEWAALPDYTTVDKAGELGAYARVVLHTLRDWLHNKADWEIDNHPWTIALEHPMRRRSTVAVFDEALDTWPVGGGHPGTHRLIQHGRAFEVTVVVGSQFANNIDTRLLRVANHIFVMGPARHETDLDALFRANQADINPLKQLKLHQIAWWSDERDHWTTFSPLRVNRKNTIFERKIKLNNNRLGVWHWLIAIGLFLGINWISSVKFGLIPTLSFVGLIAFYLLARFLRSMAWKVTLQSGSWTPVPVENEVIADNNIKKRSPKAFRIV